jgi:hypothetical protein
LVQFLLAINYKENDEWEEEVEQEKEEEEKEE